MTPVVRVLLSTYNGERYLSELIASVLAQDYPALELLIRDDGSSDRTPDILDKLARDARVTVIKGNNLGVAGSFFSLLANDPSSATYFAYADQDDYWLPGKVSRAVAALEGMKSERPRLYASRLTVTGPDLNPIQVSPRAIRPLGIGNALIESPLTGCTMVFDLAVRNLLIAKRPQGLRVHDWWTYLVVSAFGDIVIDPEPQVLYRQHAQNVYGATKGLTAKWVSRFKKLRDLREAIRVQAFEFKRLWGSILDEHERRTIDFILESRTSPAARLKLAIGNRIYRQSYLDDVAFRAMTLLTGI